MLKVFTSVDSDNQSIVYWGVCVHVRIDNVRKKSETKDFE